MGAPRKSYEEKQGKITLSMNNRVKDELKKVEGYNKLVESLVVKYVLKNLEKDN